jgi:hypothetical protein
VSVFEWRMGEYCLNEERRKHIFVICVKVDKKRIRNGERM